jgi:heme oxygenase-like protein
MATVSVTVDITKSLSENQVKNELVLYLRELKKSCGVLSREQVVVILGQWFHPLHYFPAFLSRLISVTPSIEGQTFVSRILWQELGEGEPRSAHENIYIDTIIDSEFTKQQVAEAPPFESTQKLVAGYEQASEQYLSGLGFLYGTEVADLPMVSTIGELMKRCTGKRHSPWVNIHAQQEPYHVESSNETLKSSFSMEDRQRIIESAEEMWGLWIGFFKNIKKEIFPAHQANGLS